jgi:hypothetical protein
MHPRGLGSCGGGAVHMRVTRSRVDPARGDEAWKLAHDIAAAARHLPGLQSLLIGEDRTSGQGIAVTTWDTEDHARWSREALGDRPSRIQALGVQMEPPEIFEVTST